MTKATKEGHKEEKYCFLKIMNFLCKITYVRVYIACFHLCNVGRMQLQNVVMFRYMCGYPIL